MQLSQCFFLVGKVLLKLLNLKDELLEFGLDLIAFSKGLLVHTFLDLQLFTHIGDQFLRVMELLLGDRELVL